MARTAYVFDERFTRHDTGLGHPERPERVTAIHNAITAAPFFSDLIQVQAETATVEEVALIHLPSYIKRVREEIENKIHYLDSMDTPVCEKSYEIALLAVGAGLRLCDAVMTGEATCGFANLRPPGHHAERTFASGFCIFNNIAIAAKYIKKRYGIERIGIVDWDVHHGNGTQHAFEQDNSIYFISLHQFPHFPGSGSMLEKGRGDGTGYTLNIPFSPGSGDRDYIRQFLSKVVPALEQFAPQVVLISAGYDGHRADPLSSIHLSTETYYRFTSMIAEATQQSANGKMIAFLEGGYNIEALQECSIRTIQAFLDV